MLRKTIFWLHLAAGVTAGLVILVMSATGVLLTYEKQMIARADRSDAALPPAPAAPRLSADALIDAARAAEPQGSVTGLTISAAAGAPALVTVGSRTLALNPYTAAVIGDSAPRLRAFFRSVTTWHRYLGADAGPLRQTLRLFTGWGNFAFLAIVLGGIVLWLPKKWTRPQLRNITWFKGGLRGKARDFNWHNAIGIWSFVPLVVIVASALPMSFPWANAAVYRLAGDTPPAAAAAGRSGGAAGAGRARRASDADVVSAAAIEPLVARAEQQVDGWRTISVRLSPGDSPLAFTIDTGTGGQPQRRGTLTVDRATAQVVRWETYGDQTPGRRLRTFTRFAHTGEFFGVIGQTIAGLASAGAVVLVWTGISLALRRFSSWRSRRRTAPAAAIQRSNAA